MSEETGMRCSEVGTEVDHVNPGDNHDLSNLQAICSWHHGKKSSAEGRAAKIKLEPRYRKPEKHPGSI